MGNCQIRFELVHINRYQEIVRIANQQIEYISNNDPLITLKSSPLNSRKNRQDHDLKIH